MSSPEPHQSTLRDHECRPSNLNVSPNAELFGGAWPSRVSESSPSDICKRAPSQNARTPEQGSKTRTQNAARTDQHAGSPSRELQTAERSVPPVCKVLDEGATFLADCRNFTDLGNAKLRLTDLKARSKALSQQCKHIAATLKTKTNQFSKNATRTIPSATQRAEPERPAKRAKTTAPTLTRQISDKPFATRPSFLLS